MTEECVTFGAHGTTVGILTLPEHVDPSLPVVLVWNIGLNHRVGPARLWVQLARTLAPLGFATLRFDLSGLGDSPARLEAVDDVSRAILDVQDALDFLQRRGFKSVVVMSNCSGTDSAHPVARGEPAVVGAAFIDGYAYDTLGYRARHLLRPFQIKRWQRWLRRRFPQRFGLPKSARGLGYVDEVYVRDYPSPEQVGADCAAMVARGTRLLFVFSGETNYAYEKQFYAMLPKGGWKESVAVKYLPEANHTFTFSADRQALVRLLCDWLQAEPFVVVEKHQADRATDALAVLSG